MVKSVMVTLHPGDPLTQRRNSQNGPLNVNQLGDVLVTSSLLENDSTRQSQIAIKPSGPSTPAVRLGVDHDISGLFPLADRTDFEAWRIGMTRNDAESRPRCQLSRHDESKQGRLVPCEVVFPARDDVSGLESGTEVRSSRYGLESGLGEVAHGGVYRVEWRWRGIDKLEECQRLCGCESRGRRHFWR